MVSVVARSPARGAFSPVPYTIVAPVAVDTDTRRFCYSFGLTVGPIFNTAVQYIIVQYNTGWQHYWKHRVTYLDIFFQLSIHHITPVTLLTPITEQYVQAGNIIRSNGLSTNRYNELSHILGRRKDLRERVQHQAYLYRVNADLRGDKIHPLVDTAEPAPGGDRRGRGQQVRSVLSFLWSLCFFFKAARVSVLLLRCYFLLLLITYFIYYCILLRSTCTGPENLT